jgi:RNA polymerase sigma-70 factor (ECF subfamily)
LSQRSGYGSAELRNATMTPEADGEEGLIERALSGDRSALGVLMKQQGPALRRRFAHEIPARWQSLLSIDDLLQETFTDAFLDFPSFVPQGPGALQAWLCALARHNLLNAIQMLEADKRGGNRRRVVAGREGESYVAFYELLGASTTSPSGRVARTEVAAAIDRAVEQLPADYRKVVRMYDLGGASIEEVAAALERSAGAVFMLRARAHRALRRLLGAPASFFSDSP